MNKKDIKFKSFIEQARIDRGLKLVGKCNGCGKCCNPLTSYSTNLDKKTMDVYKVADCSCIHLDQITKKCKSHHNRGILCSIFPYLPENLFEGCGYHFEKIKSEPLKLSVVMIVKNEESCLKDSLESIKEADEIIIVDTGSTDNTCKIARQYTDKVYENEYKWEDSFCKARNFANTKATGTWILVIDADEILESNGIKKIKKGIEFAEKYNQLTINCIMVANISGEEFYFPRVFKNCPKVYWEGDIHNHLNITDKNKSDIRITYKYSIAHNNDPDRALRILKKVVKENPLAIRETFYLAREYWYRKDWITAIYWYKDYLTRANWPPEWSEAWLMLSRCYWELDKADEAKDACLQAIKINADYQEALEFMAELCGPKNKAKWLLYAELANSNDVLTLRKKVEQKSDYYNKLFTDDSDMSRYYHLYNEIGKMTIDEKVLDIGCGVAGLQNFIKDYHGFDFSEKAVEIANNPNVFVGDIYDIKNYGDYDTYVSTEVLEHVDDKRVLANIPKGKKVIISVPSFEDASHLRVYTEEIIHHRWDSLLEIKNIIRFNWNSGWRLNNNLTDSYILLIEGIKK